MPKDTHVVTTNAGSHMFLTDLIRPYRDQIHLGLSMLDGDGNFAWSLWRSPEGVGLFDIDKKRFPVEFMQSAGTADAMTIEVRFVEEGGTERQYVVGRPGSDNTGMSPATFKYLRDTRELHLFPNEVFGADEAAEIYYQYYLTDRVPAPYQLRELDI